jgi:sulfoxide reductase heme-binding subunit YedZ
MAMWYFTRATGGVSLVLLTVTLVLGVVDVNRVSSPRIPRFAVDAIHRTASLLVVVLVAAHVITAVLDSFAPIQLADAVVPFGGTYRPLWLGLGALSFDLLLALVVTSLLRARIGVRAWRAVHWLAYACWPVALLHGLGTGSDVRPGWMLWLSVVCIGAVAIAVMARAATAYAAGVAVTGTLAALGAGALALAVWIPAGPLAAGWAKKAGTPPAILHPHSSTGAAQGGSR